MSLFEFHGEQFLIKRLRDHGCPMLDAGLTTAEERRKRIAAAIHERGLEQIVLGRGKDGKAMTYGQALSRLNACKPL